MNEYQVTNHGTGGLVLRNVAGKLVRIAEKSGQVVALSDENAVALRRREMAGARASITPRSREGERVLADVKPLPPRRFRVAKPAEGVELGPVEVRKGAVRLRQEQQEAEDRANAPPPRPPREQVKGAKPRKDKALAELGLRG